MRAAAFLFLVIAIALASCRAPETALPRQAPAPVAGRLIVHAAAVGDYKPVAASVATRNMGEARARIGGTLVRLTVREGDMVRAGQLIGFVQDARLNLETRAMDAQVAAAVALAEQAAQDLARIRTLYNQGIYARARLDQAEAAARTAQANLFAARAQRGASAELALQGAILAPSAGRVVSAPVPVGSVVAAGQSVATITAGATVLRIEVPERDGAQLRVGDIVRIDLASPVAPGAQGSIVQVYPAVDSGRVVADIAAPALEGALIGQRVGVQVRIGERRAIIIPRRYVETRYGLDYVRLIARDDTRLVPVQTAPSVEPGQVEVLSGLADGDAIAPPGSVR